MMKKMLLVLPFVFFISSMDAWAGFCQEGDCLNGRGIYRWSNGSNFAGQFKDGVPDGEGVFTTSDKKRFNVAYKGGKPVKTTPYSKEDEAVKARQREAKKYNHAGSEYYKKKDYKSAIFFFNKAITKWPNNAEFHKNYQKAKDKL